MARRAPRAAFAGARDAALPRCNRLPAAVNALILSFPASPTRLYRRGRWLLALGLLALYLPTLARGVTFTDGPEILTAIHTLGVAHPTGYPIFMLVAHAFEALVRLPIKPCLKVEALNALFGMGAALFTAAAARQVVVLAQGERDAVEQREADIAALLAGMMLGVSPMLWEQVHIPEVYPFHLFLVSMGGYAWLRFEVTRSDRYIYLAALPMGIGLAHHVTMVYMLGAGFLYLLYRKPLFVTGFLVAPFVRLVRVFKKSFRAGKTYPAHPGFFLACLLGFLPLLGYLYLLWANKRSPGVTWGDVHDWKSLYNHMTGAQYRRFMHGFGDIFRWERVKKVPDFFDMQFLPIGTCLFFPGLYVAWKRARGAFVFLFVYMLLNIAHTLQYSVGDYQNYYLPGIWCCDIFIALGVSATLRWARARAPGRRLVLSSRAAGLGMLSTAIATAFYAKITQRVTEPFGSHARFIVIPLGALGLAVLLAEPLAKRPQIRKAFLRRFARLQSPAGEGLLPAVLLGFLLSVFIPVALLRAWEIGREQSIGESYGEELARNIPPGSVLMTQGDGFLFTMWYEAHVLGLAKDFATLDMGNLKTGWYQRYIKMKNPERCDPLAPAFVKDPAAYEKQCGTYEARRDEKVGEPWASMGLVARKKGSGKDRTAPLDEPILRAADARCEDAAFKKAHASEECWCYEFSKKLGVDEEFCVRSADEGGIVPRAYIEVHAQRIIEDHIDERPVFERNTLTNWSSENDSQRFWDGPSYQRVSGEYTLVNRGRFNQVLYADDLRGFDPCGGQTFRPIRPRALRPPRPKSKVAELRRPYRPNDWPTLMSATFLTRTPDHRDDDATRQFTAGDTVHLWIDWFEKRRYDPSKKGHQGAPIHHGLRFCFFDPDGKKVAQEQVISGADKPKIALPLAPDAKPGTYHVQACSVGDLGDDPFPETLGCQRAVLEYAFTVESKR
ncbi:MAG: DUF2723 domain-containing protein [Byssovorax sp.]